MLDYYIYNGKEKLRCGFTTGSCAAMASKAACLYYFLNKKVKEVSIMTPKGIEVSANPLNYLRGNDFSSSSVIKDAGDDIDATDKIEINAKVVFTEDNEIVVDGGLGVGRVTKKGLASKIGEAAINPVPKEMIKEAVKSVFKRFGYFKGARIIISVPQGEEIAKKTFNPHLGIEGGISILGSSGIVEPKSLKALKDSVFLEMKILKEEGKDSLVLTPGNYGELFIEEKYENLRKSTVKCSNFIGESLDEAAVLGFKNVLLIGHIGKLCKLGAGIMDTHSKVADGRREVFTCYSALAGAGKDTLLRIMDSVTTIECLEVLEETGLKEKVMDLIIEASQSYLERRASGYFKIGIIIFDQDNKIIGKSKSADEILRNCFEV